MKILVAEDHSVSLRLLEVTLQKWGHEPILAQNGRDAWDALTQGPAPPVAILDWMMPHLSGVDLCRKIREVPRLRQMYVLLLTAKGTKDDVLMGLDAGADDYVIKPFDMDELLARLNVGKRVAELQDNLAKKNKALMRYAVDMEVLAEERSKQLIHSERMASVGIMAAGIAHEINNPSTFISSNALVQQRFWEKIQPVLEANKEADGVEFVLEEMPKTIVDIQKGVKRISKIVNGLRTFCRQDSGDKEPTDIHERIDASLVLCQNVLKKHVTVKTTFLRDLPLVFADAQQLEQVFINLFTNAAHATEEKQDAVLHIQTKQDKNWVIVTISDNGPGVPKDKLQDIWQPFYTSKPVGKGTGLGLSITQGIIESHEGEIFVENNSDGGACFTIKLPIRKGQKA